MNQIVKFIYTELELVRKGFLKGLYSREFALGHLSSLYNLAGVYKLGELMNDIRETGLYYCNSISPEHIDSRQKSKRG
jgi:hypothetical protein